MNVTHCCIWCLAWVHPVTKQKIPMPETIVEVLIDVCQDCRETKQLNQRKENSK